MLCSSSNAVVLSSLSHGQRSVAPPNPRPQTTSHVRPAPWHGASPGSPAEIGCHVLSLLNLKLFLRNNMLKLKIKTKLKCLFACLFQTFVYKLSCERINANQFQKCQETMIMKTSEPREYSSGSAQRQTHSLRLISIKTKEKNELSTQKFKVRTTE